VRSQCLDWQIRNARIDLRTLRARLAEIPRSPREDGQQKSSLRHAIDAMLRVSGLGVVRSPE
jgi:hypothetical protein